MKKIIAIIVAVTAIVIAGFLVAENSYSKEKIEFVGEAKNIEYYFEKMYFYNTLQDEFDATANLLNINAKAVALDENEKIPCYQIKTCSLCGCRVNGTQFNFCPHCGAKMEVMVND